MAVEHPKISALRIERGDKSVARWVCTDMCCAGGELYIVDLEDRYSPRYSQEVALLLREGLCPNDHPGEKEEQV